MYSSPDSSPLFPLVHVGHVYLTVNTDLPWGPGLYLVHPARPQTSDLGRQERLGYHFAPRLDPTVSLWPSSVSDSDIVRGLPSPVSLTTPFRPVHFVPGGRTISQWSPDLEGWLPFAENKTKHSAR